MSNPSQDSYYEESPTFTTFVPSVLAGSVDENLGGGGGIPGLKPKMPAPPGAKGIIGITPEKLMGTPGGDPGGAGGVGGTGGIGTLPPPEKTGSVEPKIRGEPKI